MSANLYDSDWDYYDSCLTQEQKLASDLLTGDAPSNLSEHYWACYELLCEASKCVSDWDYALEYSTDYFKQKEEI